MIMYKVVKTDTLQKGDVFLVEYGDYDNWVKVKYDHCKGAWVYGTYLFNGMEYLDMPENYVKKVTE